MLELIHNIAFQQDNKDISNFIPTNGLEFDFVTELQINSTWENLTDTATLTFPRKLRYTKNGQVINNIVQGDNPLFKRGVAFKAMVGYGNQTAERFRGYISDITPRNPLFFEFEDAMYILKQTFIKAYSKENVTLQSLLTDILPDGFKFRVNASIDLGRFRRSGSTVAEVLKFLREDYGVISFIRKDTLISGVAYENRSLDTVKLHEINLEQFGIETDGLKFVREDDQRIKVRAVSIFDNNTKIEVEVGDPDGGERTQYFYGVNESTLRQYANEQLEKFKYTGFEGSFTTFVNPIIQHGDAVKLISEQIPDANGVYLVKGVTTTSGVFGGRQTIELDIKI